MATKLTVLLFISSILILLLTTVIVLVPNLISFKMCLSMTEIQTFMQKMRQEQGTQGPKLTTDGPPSPACDFGLSVSVGVWRCKFATAVPTALLAQAGLLGQAGQGVPVGPLGQAAQGGTAGLPGQLSQGNTLSSLAMVPYTWEGSYSTLGDNAETAFAQVTSMMDSMGVGHEFFGETAAEALGDLTRTIYIRVEIEVTMAVLFAFVAVVITFLNMFGEKKQTKPLYITSAALCYIIQAILLGVALGSFAQQLHQILVYGHIYKLVTITSQGLGLLALGFSVVFAAIIMAMTHLWMLVGHLSGKQVPSSDVKYNPLTQIQDA
ncbi:uncharacterized protein LOC117333322 [Pecten maximus]|uniref:uncharacterized protein LOC117333322 n=1 Tax=Pecten maximus TaxID=6579 RepID=UPI001457F2A9|nr:uncharacterized protein LOC117333322 [Pecten maximus]